MKRVLFTLAALLVLTGIAGAAIDRDYLAKLPPIIDRDVLFGDPQIASGQLSPDGSHISFLKPYKNILNIWVKGASEPFAAARPVTADTTRPVRGYFWTKDGKYILYVQDKGGDENWHIYAVDPRAKLEAGQDVPPPRDLTPYENVAATIYALPKGMPGAIFVGLNDRDERYHDAYRLDIATGERTLVKRNDNEISSWIFDVQGNPPARVEADRRRGHRAPPRRSRHDGRRLFVQQGRNGRSHPLPQGRTARVHGVG